MSVAQPKIAKHDEAPEAKELPESTSNLNHTLSLNGTIDYFPKVEASSLGGGSGQKKETGNREKLCHQSLVKQMSEDPRKHLVSL